MLDFELFCRTHNLDYVDSGHHHCHEGWMQIHCVFCAGGISGYHLGFSLDGGNFNCWRCGSHSVWDVTSEILNTKRKDLIARAIAECSTNTPKHRKKTNTQRARRLKDIPGSGALVGIHKKYLSGRALSARDLSETWGAVGTQHLSGLWSFRVVVPICNLNGEKVAWIGRTIRKTFKPKYKISDDADCLEDPKTFVYGIDKVPGDSVVIVEGPADVWKLGVGSVALLGIDWKNPQANILRKFKKRFVIFDPGKQAQKRARRLGDWLSLFPGETEIVSGFETDPGGMSKRQAKKVMLELCGI